MSCAIINFAEILTKMKSRVFVFLLLISVIGACKNEDAYIGDRYYRNGEYEKAIEAYTEYLQLKPSNIKSIYNRGRAYEELGEYNAAVMDFKKVIDIDPNHVQARLSVASDLYRNKLYKDAIYQCDLVLEHTQSAMAYFIRARGNQKSGNINLAMDDYKSAISLDSEFGEAYFYRGTLQIYRKQKSAACNDFKIAESLDIATATKARKDYCR